jgi:Ricin-type beta-trefoil lectin domain-like
MLFRAGVGYAAGNGTALDARGESTVDEAAVEQWDFWNGPTSNSSLFRQIRCITNFVSRNSGKVLNVMVASIANGPGIKHRTSWGHPHRQLIPTTTSSLARLAAEVLDVSNQLTSNGVPLSSGSFRGASLSSGSFSHSTIAVFRWL